MNDCKPTVLSDAKMVQGWGVPKLHTLTQKDVQVAFTEDGMEEFLPLSEVEYALMVTKDEEELDIWQLVAGAIPSEYGCSECTEDCTVIEHEFCEGKPWFLAYAKRVRTLLCNGDEEKGVEGWVRWARLDKFEKGVTNIKEFCTWVVGQ